MIPVDTLTGAALLDQASVWQCWGDEGQLVTVLVGNMTTDHQARTLAWLREHAQLLIDHRKDSISRLHKRGLLGEEEYFAELRYLEALDPHVWLEDQPLVRRLAALVPRPAVLPARRLLRLRNPRRWFR